MTVNFTLLAQNSDVNYVEQAYACAMSIKLHVPNSKVCLITNDELSDKHKLIFDDVVSIPWGDMAANHIWKVNNRWKIYHVTPYESTIVMDTDMLVLEDITRWWNFLQDYDLFYVSKPITYRGEPVISNYYRKAFAVNNLPNLYSGFHFFKKTNFSKHFFTLLEIVMKDWKVFYEKYAGGMIYQNFLSVDLCASIVTKILGCEHAITSPHVHPTFVHMKSHLQNWKSSAAADWQLFVKAYMNANTDLKVGNYTQCGVFHYTEDTFLTRDIIEKYENRVGI